MRYLTTIALLLLAACAQPEDSAVTAPPAPTAQHDHGSMSDMPSLLDPDGADRVTPGFAANVRGLRGIDPADPPAGSAVGRALGYVGDAYATLTYGRPYKRRRVVFGGLVPYGEVWATGAHFATEITFTEAVMIGPGAGEHLEAGTYSIQTVPGETSWTVHFNRELGMHLADDYDASQDALSLEVPVEALGETVEALTIDFLDAAPADGIDMRIRWDQTGVTVPLRRC